MRAAFVRLADPVHRLPIPGVPGAVFPADGRTVDADDPFWWACLADGSLIESPAPVESAAPDPASPDPASTAPATA